MSKTERMIQIINEFRKLDPELQAQAMMIYLKIVKHSELNEEISMKDIQHWSGLANSSISRNIALLGDVNRHGEPGLLLVKSYPDPLDRRRSLCKLTAKGKAVWQTISNLVGE